MTTRTPLWRILAVLFSFALVATACGDDDTSTDDDAAPTESTVVATGDVPVDSESTDLAIVSLSPTATEMLFAIGAGDLVVAADDFSNFPEEAPTTDLSGFEPNVEAIAGYEPDVVVASFIDEETVGGLEALGIEVQQYPAAVTLDDTWSQISALGELTGNTAEAEALVAELQGDIDELVALVPDRDEPLTYYYELDNTYFSVTSNTFIGEVLALAGLVNIADEADEAGTGYPQLSEEYIISASPDVILNACTKFCDTDAASIAARPGWDTIAAVQNDLIVDLDDDVASRWGPRIVDLLETVIKATASA